MEWDAVFLFLAGLWAPAQMIFSYVGLALTIAHLVIMVTPSKKDDAWEEKAYKVPVVGDLLVALKRLSPFKFLKKE
jgi:hypothetical protein